MVDYNIQDLQVQEKLILILLLLLLLLVSIIFPDMRLGGDCWKLLRIIVHHCLPLMHVIKPHVSNTVAMLHLLLHKGSFLND